VVNPSFYRFRCSIQIRWEGLPCRTETAGIALIVVAICTKHKEDSDRIDRGAILLDDLYDYFKKR